MSEKTMQKRRVAGIICEYNPFHTGHKHQIDLLREMGYETIICAMSGNYTERGEIAIADKYTRAESAVLCGADLVLELPFPYSSLSAEGFARAGVHILSQMGVDTLCFGSETADKEFLCKAAEVVTSEVFRSNYADKKDVGSAKAYFEVLSGLLGGDMTFLSNDILAISYIAAVREMGYDINLLPIRREGSDYKESSLQEGKHPSATALRALVTAKQDFSALSGSVPEEAFSALLKAQELGMSPAQLELSGSSLPDFFRLMTPELLRTRAVMQSDGGKDICADGCGLTERICNAADGAEDIQSLLSTAYNTRYPDARINRVLLFALFGVSDRFEKALPSYTTILAASQEGRQYLSYHRKDSSFPVVTKPADAPESAETHILQLSDLFYLSCTPQKQDRLTFLKKRPFIEI